MGEKQNLNENEEVAAIDETVEEVEETVSEIEQLTKELEETQDRYLRVQAELANIQKRNAKERQDAAKYRSQVLANELLPVVDNLERALEIEVEDEKALNLKKGVEMVYNSFVEALKSEGIEVINPVNEPFDPNFHMSIQVQALEEGQEADTVVSVVQKGYSLKDRVLRPAMVIVAQ
ncbi:nucleotide exchange factor GrpE [Jeotgalibaca ciconiae]|uniref:nucleotide exchange factor GrpE n=1 Tax=Jeotgalibaca ciconiae TaxID=2496265 RepID=UPI0026C1D1DE|nr:nucleotide exchange factor GrpE [Jeotgalibaca ciconiae]